MNGINSVKSNINRR